MTQDSVHSVLLRHIPDLDIALSILETVSAHLGRTLPPVYRGRRAMFELGKLDTHTYD